MATANHNLSEYDLADVPSAKPFQIAVLKAEWNAEITDGLSNGAIETLKILGIDPSNLIVESVPGSYELPSGAQYLFNGLPSLDAVICLGAVIQGETKHFDFVCEAVAQGVKDLSLAVGKPVIFGVLTDNDIEQSRARSGGKLGNKGVEAAVSAVKMCDLRRKYSKL